MESIGNYDLVAKIAEGGMGAVYQARSRKTGETVAIKIVPAQTARNQTLMKRFEREFLAAHEIDHPHVVKAIELCQDVPTPFLVMEFVDGESLGQKIDREGRLTEDESKRIIVQVCQGLHRAHKHNLIHRDIKPDNILLTKDGTAKITDLGLVKELGEEELNLTRTGRGLGTPHFMAPEQFRDAKNVDVRCDVYSVGATLYMMVTGQMPFDGSGPLDCWMKKIRNEFPEPRQIVPALSERMNWAIKRAMSAERDRRPANCREFVEDLLGHSTRTSDVGQQTSDVTDLWYLVYRDEENQPHTVKGTTDGIRRALSERLLGDAGNIQAARNKQGPFLPLESYPEYRDLLVAPAPLATKQPTPTARSSPSPRASAPSLSAARQAPPVASGRHGTPSGRASAISGRAGAPGPGQAAPPPAINPYLNADQAAPEYQLPHIKLETRGAAAAEWLMWIMLVVLALATAAAVYVQFFR
jgi:serine/threonine protein kinase